MLLFMLFMMFLVVLWLVLVGFFWGYVNYYSVDIDVDDDYDNDVDLDVVNSCKAQLVGK